MARFLLSVPSKTSDKDIIQFIATQNQWLKKHAKSKVKVLDDFQETSIEHFERYKSDALKFSTRRVIDLNKYQWSIAQVKVKRMKTRWGSCSPAGNLNFNYKILFLPPDLQDYLIIHELCHLKHANHSADFWQEVAGMCSNYKNLDRRLRKI